MTGCRHNAKNTLVKNYLYLAEQNGAKVLPLTTVTRVAPRDGRRLRRRRVKFTKAKRATAATQDAHRRAGGLRGRRARHPEAAAPDEGRGPPARPLRPARLPVPHQLRVDPRRDRARRDPIDYSHGVAITSSFHPDEDTHIEPVRYGKGCNAMALLQTVLTDGDGAGPRWRTWLKEMWTQRANVVDLYDLKHWSERTVIALVMQTLDNSITTYGKRGRLTRQWRMTSQQGHGAPNPTWIPVANEVVRRMAAIDGRHRRRQHRRAVQHAADRALHRRLRDRRLAGDRRHRPLPAGLRPPRPARRRRRRRSPPTSGVNPSLTITAQAERAMAFWPNKGEADPRPALGRAYAADRSPVAPSSPVVPDSAPGALRLPIVGVS